MKSNDDLWAEIVRRLRLNLERPLNTLTETQLKVALGGRKDLRNLVSMTSINDWASPLQEKGVFVLPKSRKEWMLVHGKGYEKLEDPGEPEPFRSRLPIRLSTLTYGRGENPFLNHAYHSGLLSHFTGVSTLFETLSGRSGTSAFRFRVDGSPELRVEKGTQMDIDKGYESEDAVLLFEAKARPQKSFLIRQLYYPFRSHRDFQQTTGLKPKSIRPFVFVADPEEGTYSLWQFEWPDSEVDDYEAIRFVKARKFRIDDQTPAWDQYTGISPGSSVPEIQANDLGKVTNLPFLIPQGIDTAQKWAEHYGFALRQGNYYQAAAAALGLVTSEEGTFVLTDGGKRFVTLSPPERDKLTAVQLLKVPTINRVFIRAQERGEEGVTDAEIARIIEETQGLQGKTPGRRASTVRSWFRWLAVATGTVVVEQQRIYSRAGWEKRVK
jgi:hypothetical protein